MSLHIPAILRRIFRPTPQNPATTPRSTRRPVSRGERIALILLLLGTWFLRWVALFEVPPGWRDDDLIELYTFSLRVAQEGPVLYFDSASGQGPLYHTLRAPVVALAGVNQASARWMAAMAFLPAVVLTWAVGRRMLGRAAGLFGAALMSISFWSLMYSRVAIRHVGVLPWIMLAIYWGWRQLHDEEETSKTSKRPIRVGPIVGIALGVAGGMLTYYAGRVVPVFLIAAYPLAAPRRGGRRWVGYATGLLLGLLLTVPTFWTAAHLPGADARVSELAGPIYALQEGDPGPMVRNVWTTLGMFHAKGDPEWLYNLSERPVFGPVGAALFYAALIVAVVRWRNSGARWLLLWLAAGVGPSLISFPPSSYGHSVMALPAVYLLMAGLAWTVGRRWRRAGLAAAVAIAAVVGIRDLSDYFGVWPAHSMVRFLYRADYRNLVDHLEEHREIRDLTVGSVLSGSWDKVAVETDLKRDDVGVRWINPARTMVFTGGNATRLYLQDEGERHLEIQRWLDGAERIEAPAGMQAYLVDPSLSFDRASMLRSAHTAAHAPARAVTHDVEGNPLADQPLGDAMALESVTRAPSDADASDSDKGPISVVMRWRVIGDLPLPEEVLISNPPPPGVYNGPRLKVFAHLMAGEEVVGIDDGLWLNPWSLEPGDVIVQFHRFKPPEATDGRLTLRIGLYDPLLGTRWTTPGGSDTLVVTAEP